MTRANDILFIDFETYSDIDIKVGACRYMQSDNFRMLLVSYSMLDHEVYTWDFEKAESQDLPDIIEDHIQAGGRIGGWSQFERLVLNRVRGVELPHEQYVDVMILAAEAGLPLGLAKAGVALKCPAVKDPVGRLAILKFCKPHKGKRILPADDPELWAGFVQYCGGDTALMMEIYKRLPAMTTAEYQLYHMDMRMNDRGIRLDKDACQVLLTLSDQIKDRLNEVMVQTTDGKVETIGQVAKIAEYCGTTSASAPALLDAINAGTLDEGQEMVARLRLAGGKSSTAKIPKMLSSMFDDERSRGTLQFCGTKTKRKAGRIWQPHNLPRKSYPPSEVDKAIEVARLGLKEFAKVYSKPLEAVSMMLRGLLIPAPEHEFVIADYSAIEARVLCWYAQQEDILQVYDVGGDVYKVTGASIFAKPVEDITGAERFQAKTVVLGSGYGLGFAGLQRNLAGMGTMIEEEDAKKLTHGYREKFYRVVEWWAEIMGALADALEGEPSRHYGGLLFGKEGDDVYIELGTGNRLWYHELQWEVKKAPWDESRDLNVLTARNYNSDDGRYDVTHSIIAENICSMTAREILMRGMLRCELAGYPPVMSIHDEVVLEVPKGFGSLDEVDQLLCEQPWYAERLPLATESFRSPRYSKEKEVLDEKVAETNQG